MQERLRSVVVQERLIKDLEQVIHWADEKNEDKRYELALGLSQLSSLDRSVILSGVILWGSELAANSGEPESLPKPAEEPCFAKILQDLLSEIEKEKIPPNEQAIIWQISLNRKAMPALQKSVPPVKGDAARSLFKVNCDEIRWAVLDSGIDGNHPAFYGTPIDPKATGDLRIVKAYDFGNIRRIVSLDNEDIDKPILKDRLDELLKGRKISRKAAIADLKKLASDAGSDRPIYWELVEKFIAVDPSVAPVSPHGTHVAGIIGARGTEGEGDGMCPDIKLLDFRVLGKTLQDMEFAIIAALQFIRYLNEQMDTWQCTEPTLALRSRTTCATSPADARQFATNASASLTAASLS